MKATDARYLFMRVFNDADINSLFGLKHSIDAFSNSQDLQEEGRRTKAFVRFNPLVTAAIQSMKFRQLDYAKLMSFSSVIARQLHKRISHHYTQASEESQPYTIMLSLRRFPKGTHLYSREVSH